MGRKGEIKSDVGNDSAPHLFGWLIAGLILAIIAFIITGVFIPEVHPEVDSVAISGTVPLFIALIGLFTGTIVYMRIYDYVNLRNQIREWRHEIANRRVEQVYLPLLEETKWLRDKMEGFDDVHAWAYDHPEAAEIFGEKAPIGLHQIDKTYAGIFVDVEVRKLAKEFYDAVVKYHDSDEALDTVLDNLINELVVKHRVERNPIARYFYGEYMRTAIRDRDGTRQHRYSGAGFKQLFIDAESPPADPDGLLLESVKRFRESNEMDTYQDSRRIGLKKADALTLRMATLIKNPEKIILELG